MKNVGSKTVLLVLVTAMLSACEFSFSTARVSDAKLSKEVNDKSEAVNPTADFSDDDAVIHCVVELANAPSDTKVRARWIGVKAEGLKENEQLAETDTEAGSSKNIVDFTLKPANGGLPPGDYKVDIYLNPKAGKESPPDKSLTFNVKATAPYITSAVLSTNEDGDPPATYFPPDTQEIHCRALLRGQVAGAKILSALISEEVEGLEANSELTRTKPETLKKGDSFYHASFSSKKPLPPGQYRVELYLSPQEKPVWSLQFIIKAI